MQQAIPFKSWQPFYTNNKPLNLNLSPATWHHGTASMAGLLSDNPVIVLSRRGCCMSHVVKRLLLGLGVNPAVCEIDEGDGEATVVKELETMIVKNNGGFCSDDKTVPFPAVFIGGRLFGGLDRLMAAHISGELVPILKQAGALWL